ncbi:MAG TPA: hypothetical protein VIL47_03890 [Candidatus Bipolaricaulota bacterium]
MVLALGLAFAVPAFQGLAASEEGGDYYDLKIKVTQLEKQLDSMGDLLKDLTFNVQENQALSEIVKELSFQLKKSESDIHSITSLQDRIERDVIPQMISIQSTVASLGASLSEKVKALGIRVYDTESSIQQLSARVKANEDRLRALDGIEDAVRGINERVYAIEKALDKGAIVSAGASDSDLADKVNALYMQVQALKGMKDQVDSLTANVSGYGSQIQSVADGLSGVEFSLDGLRTRLAVAEAAQVDFVTVEKLEEVQSEMTKLSDELQKARSASNTNFLVAILGVLAGIGALSMVLLQ